MRTVFFALLQRGRLCAFRRSEGNDHQAGVALLLMQKQRARQNLLLVTTHVNPDMASI